MPKWSSPLFTDIRNALGESVVFSIWKGRSYFRSWVKPANPRTPKQQANRAVLAELVKRWQLLSVDQEVVTAWNKIALPYTISGFNIFTKFGMESNVSCPESGTVGTTFTITYDLGIPVNMARLYAIRIDGRIIDLTPAAGLSPGKEQTVNVTIHEEGIYDIYLACSEILKEGDLPPQHYQAITCWSRDNINGVAKRARITIS